MAKPTLNIVIVAENISNKMGGEAKKIFQYIDEFQARGHCIWVVCHGRVEAELRELYSEEDFARMMFIRDRRAQRLIYRFGKLFPHSIQSSIFELLIFSITQLQVRSRLKALIRQYDVDVVFQPNPNSPLAPSGVFGINVPVVVGPLTGGMAYPEGFKHLESRFSKWAMVLGKLLTKLLHHWLPGKKQADRILIANSQTGFLLPKPYTGSVTTGVLESGVDLGFWQRETHCSSKDSAALELVFVGRLVRYKGVEYLLKAFTQACEHVKLRLTIVGSGPELAPINQLIQDNGLSELVSVKRFLDSAALRKTLEGSDVFVFPLASGKWRQRALRSNGNGVAFYCC